MRLGGKRLSVAAVLTAGAGLLLGGVAPAAPSANQCTFTDGEWTRCIQVAVSMPAAPSVAATVPVTVTINSQVDVAAAAVEIDLPAILRWSTAPAGFSTARHAAAAPETGGSVDRAARTVALSRGQTVTLTGAVAGVSAGAGPIEVAVAGPAHSQTDTAATSQVVTVGDTATASRLGYQAAAVNGTALTPAGTVISRATPRLPAKSVGTKGLATPNPPPGVHPDALTCVRGSWNYQDQTGAFHPSANFQVQLWAAGIFGNRMLSADITDAAGNYRLCSSSAGGSDVWVRFVAENGKWSVANGDGPYAFVSQTVQDIGNGATVDLGGLHPSDGNLMRALHAFDEINDASEWTPGDCWAATDHDCRVVRFLWSPTSTDGSRYETGENTVHLRANDPNFRSIVVHELGHAVMDEAYKDNFPAAPNCFPTHFIQAVSSAGCAWTEGFADWYQSAVYADPEYAGDGFTVDLETPTWGTPDWANGDTVEGRVAGAMNDVADSAAEPYWDNYGEGAPGHLWDTFLNHRSATFHDFWTQRGADNFDVSDGPLGSLFQNTIDYGFRNPLADNQSLTRPDPLTPHNYHFTTTTVFWSVVAVRPPAGADYDLFVYGDRPQTQLLAASQLGAGTTDFVAVDSNRRPLGDYYPQVRAVSGHGPYQIELAQGASQLPAASSATIPMGANDVVAVRDVCGVTAGSTVTLTVTPSDPGQDAELFLMGSDPAQPSTFVQPRSANVAQASGAGPGQPESLTYTATSAGCFGAVVVNKGGAGSYTLTRS
ncbi:MAG TPA: hypothetical protein VL652_09010 [Kutzneria sp.]|nr:hypothetical protein [Kutzneria sp.]